MTLDKIYTTAKKSKPSPILKVLQQNNPFNNMEVLLSKAGMNKEESAEFLRKPDSISVRNLNKLMSICEIDLKLLLLTGEDLEATAEEEMSDIYLGEDDSWEDTVDWRDEAEESEESEEDVYWV